MLQDIIIPYEDRLRESDQLDRLGIRFSSEGKKKKPIGQRQKRLLQPSKKGGELSDIHYSIEREGEGLGA